MSGVPRAIELGLMACHVCGLASSAEVTSRCPRCAAVLHARKPDSLARSAAYLLAALVCFIPANLLPAMQTGSFGRDTGSTIMGGVIEFWAHGAWEIAAVIFIASIAVPATKFAVMALLLWTSYRRSAWAQPQRARLYRLVELVGYWSMLDVGVVALVSALVQFKLLGTAEPRLGIVFFGAVVVLTMLSAMSFDPRLIWDGKVDERG